MTLTAYIGEREIASKELIPSTLPDFKTRVETNKYKVEREISKVKKAVNGHAPLVRFIITAQSKMNTL